MACIQSLSASLVVIGTAPKASLNLSNVERKIILQNLQQLKSLKLVPFILAAAFHLVNLRQNMESLDQFCAVPFVAKHGNTYHNESKNL